MLTNCGELSVADCSRGVYTRQCRDGHRGNGSVLRSLRALVGPNQPLSPAGRCGNGTSARPSKVRQEERRKPMFTGLVELRASVQALVADPPGVRLVVAAPSFAQETKIGDSIAVNGCCLTVVEVSDTTFGFDAGAETLSRTNLGRLTSGSFVNLERSLRLGDRVGGHFVTGHIDGLGYLDQRIDDKDWSTFWFRVPKPLTHQMASKGSIAVDGVSLTLVDVEEDRFSVALIPHTLDVTTLGPMQKGDPVNLETDVLAKYVERQLRGGEQLLAGPFAKWGAGPAEA